MARITVHQLLALLPQEVRIEEWVSGKVMNALDFLIRCFLLFNLLQGHTTL